MPHGQPLRFQRRLHVGDANTALDARRPAATVDLQHLIDADRGAVRDEGYARSNDLAYHSDGVTLALGVIAAWGIAESVSIAAFGLSAHSSWPSW